MGACCGRLCEPQRSLARPQVASLQEALASRHPNSLPAALIAARPPPGEGRVVAALQAEVQALAERLRAAQREHEHSLRGLQQQHEQLKAQAARERAQERAEVRAGPRLLRKRRGVPGVLAPLRSIGSD
jgi:hypothetical protein